VENAAGEIVHQVDVERERVLSAQVAFQMVTRCTTLSTAAPARPRGGWA